jgi:hypothetical protein
MQILKSKISVAELKTLAVNLFGNMVKAVVDVRQRKIAVDAELHSDEEALLLESGSNQEDLWGINIYPDLDRASPDFVEFDSMINLRPSQKNRSRGVEDKAIRDQILSIVDEWIQ